MDKLQEIDRKMKLIGQAIDLLDELTSEKRTQMQALMVERVKLCREMEAEAA